MAWRYVVIAAFVPFSDGYSEWDVLEPLLNSEQTGQEIPTGSCGINGIYNPKTEHYEDPKDIRKLECDKRMTTNCSVSYNGLRCPAACGFLVPNTAFSCLLECVPANECSARNPNRAFPNPKTGICEPCPITGCKENNGTAHFLEHMAFKGTKKRNRLHLEKEIEDMGGHLNAYTSREQTVYYAKCFKDDLRQGVDILADILQNSTLDQGNLDFERGVILREMEEVEKTVEEVIFDRLHLTAFHDSPLGYTILGPVENIQSITREQLREYIQNNYKADRMVVAAAGPVEHDQLATVVDEFFGSFPHSKPGDMRSEEKPQFTSSELLYRNEDTNGIAHFAIGYEGVPWTHPDSITFMVIQSILGSHKRGEGLVPPKLSGNRLTTTVANNMEDCMPESFAAFNTCYKDTGLFGFYAQCEEAAVEGCMEELLFGICSLAHSVTEEDVERGKRQLKTTLFGSLDSTTALAEDIGRQLLVYGRRIPISELLLRMDAIDAAEVRRVARQHLTNADIALTGLGPIDRLPPLVQLRQRTAAQRH